MEQPLYLSITPVATTQKLAVTRELSSLPASSTNDPHEHPSGSNDDDDIKDEEKRNTPTHGDASRRDAASRPSLGVAHPASAAASQEALDDGPKLPLTRLMERLRIHRTDSRLQELVQDLMINKNQSKTPPLVLMTGPRGCGTSHVIRMSLQDMLDKQGGFFLQGKCHVYHNDLPYPALVGAFTEFVHVVMRRGHQKEMRRIILDAISPSHVPILIDMIPALAQIIGDTSSSRTLGEETTETRRHQRFIFVFGALVRAICDAGHPIVLFLQDLNLCDASSLDYYSMLVTNPRYSGLIFVGSCNTGVSGTSYLSRRLRQIEDQLQKPVHNLEVNNLKQDEVHKMMENAMELAPGNEVTSLSKLVSEHTAGNLLLIVSLIRWLVHAKLLEFDDLASIWKWNEQEIRLRINPNMTVDDYVGLELGQLSEPARETLQIAACLGPDLCPPILSKVLSQEQIERTTLEAYRRGLLGRHKVTDQYSFAHETVRVASYSLIPADLREQLHLKIGRRILRALDSDEMERAIYLVLSQLKLCQRLIRDDERVAVARLCLHAGNKAAKSSANVTAIAFLEMGLSLLGPRSWRDDYDLTLALSNAAAEIHMCTNSFDRMDGLLNDVFANARNLHDQLPAYSTRLCGLASMERSPDALKLGKEVLSRLGEPLPKRPSIPLLVLEMVSVVRLLRGKSDEQLLRMPPATNAEKIACMQLLHIIFLDASYCDPIYCPFIAIKLMKLTLKYGFSAFTAATFVYYGVTILSRDVPGGLRYGELSLKFLHRFGAKEFIPRVYFIYYGVILHWNRPMKAALQPLIDAYHIGNFTGDISAAGLSANAYVLTCLEAGESLTSLEPRIMWLVNELTAKHQQHTVFSLLVTAQSVHHYMGLSDDPLCPQGDLLNHDDAHAVAKAKGNFMNALIVPCTRMIVALMFDDYALATSLVEPYLKYMWNVPVNTGVVSIVFFVSLAKFGCAREGRQPRKTLRFVSRALKRLKKYSPPTALDKIYMLKAEVCSFRGDNCRAVRYYRVALALAHQNEVPFMQAIINEYMARHFQRLGDKESTILHFRAACEGYVTWGGTAKVKRLVEMIHGLEKGDFAAL